VTALVYSTQLTKSAPT